MGEMSQAAVCLNRFAQIQASLAHFFSALPLLLMQKKKLWTPTSASKRPQNPLQSPYDSCHMHGILQAKFGPDLLGERDRGCVTNRLRGNIHQRRPLKREREEMVVSRFTHSLPVQTILSRADLYRSIRCIYNDIFRQKDRFCMPFWKRVSRFLTD